MSFRSLRVQAPDASISAGPCLALAWLFVAGRVLHRPVQVFTTNIRLRGLVFMVNFLAVFGLWVMLVLSPQVRA